MDRRHEAPRRVDLPEIGTFAVRLVKGGPEVAAEIIHRRGLWGAIINGDISSCAVDWVDVPSIERVMLGRRIDRAEYDRLLALSRDPSHPCSRPYQAVDLTEVAPLF